MVVKSQPEMGHVGKERHAAVDALPATNLPEDLQTLWFNRDHKVTMGIDDIAGQKPTVLVCFLEYLLQHMNI